MVAPSLASDGEESPNTVSSFSWIRRQWLTATLQRSNSLGMDSATETILVLELTKTKGEKCSVERDSLRRRQRNAENPAWCKAEPGSCRECRLIPQRKLRGR